MKAMQTLDEPMRAEARAYCDYHEIESGDDAERVRVWMCVREFQNRMKPFYDQLVKLHPSMYSVSFGPEPESYVKLRDQVREIAKMEAERLGLSLETIPEV